MTSSPSPPRARPRRPAEALRLFLVGLICQVAVACAAPATPAAAAPPTAPVAASPGQAADAIGADIITIEGLADGDKLHPVQQAFIDTGAVQCGYCTPGYIMSVKALFDRTKKPTAADIEEAVSGNICRCTGYTKIVDAIQLAAQNL